MKKILILILFISFIFANLNKELLYIEAKLYPKIMMLVKDLKNKNKIKVAIISNKKTYKIAKTLKDFIKNEKLKVDIIKKVNLNYDVYILTYPLNKKEIDKLISHKKIIFSTSSEDINSSMFSIYIGARVYPYINPYLIKRADIKIDPILFKVGKIYE